MDHSKIPLQGGDRIQLKEVISLLHRGAAAMETPDDLTPEELADVPNDLHNMGEALEQADYTLILQDEIVELMLCETERLALKPDVIYRFKVDQNCESCCRLAAVYK